MKSLSVDELQAHTGEAIQEVRSGETIEVTNQGEVVALLVPMPVRSAEEAHSQAWATLRSLEALRAEVAKHVTEPVDVTQIISDMRR